MHNLLCSGQAWPAGSAWQTVKGALRAQQDQGSLLPWPRAGPVMLGLSRLQVFC